MKGQNIPIWQVTTCIWVYFVLFGCFIYWSSFLRSCFIYWLYLCMKHLLLLYICCCCCIKRFIYHIMNLHPFITVINHIKINLWFCRFITVNWPSLIILSKIYTIKDIISGSGFIESIGVILGVFIYLLFDSIMWQFIINFHFFCNQLV